MKNKSLLVLFYLIFFPFTNQAQTKGNSKEIFKNSIESALINSSDCVNQMLNKFYNIFEDGDVDSFSVNEYESCKSKVLENKNLVLELTEADNEINLKQKAIKYIDNCEKILDDFILPLIDHINAPNQTEIFDPENLKTGMSLVETSLDDTDVLSNSLDEFCKKYNLQRTMNSFDKEEFAPFISTTKPE